MINTLKVLMGKEENIHYQTGILAEICKLQKIMKWNSVSEKYSNNDKQENCQTQNSIPIENNLQRWREIQTFLKKQNGIHCQQTYLTVNAKEISLGRENMVAAGNWSYTKNEEHQK